MSALPDGAFVCDGCGTDLANGAITECVIVSDLDPDTPYVPRQLHFCRDRTESEGDDAQEVHGCERKLLNAATIRHYTERREAAARG